MILIISGAEAFAWYAICVVSQRKAAVPAAAGVGRNAIPRMHGGSRPSAAGDHGGAHDSTSAEQEGPQVALMSNGLRGSTSSCRWGDHQAATPPERTPKGTADDPVVGRLIST